MDKYTTIMANKQTGAAAKPFAAQPCATLGTRGPTHPESAPYHLHNGYELAHSPRVRHLPQNGTQPAVWAFISDTQGGVRHVTAAGKSKFDNFGNEGRDAKSKYDNFDKEGIAGPID